jgi:hypothetical protein
MKFFRRLLYAIKTTFSLYTLKRKSEAVQRELGNMVANLHNAPVPRNRAERRAFARKGIF